MHPLAVQEPTFDPKAYNRRYGKWNLVFDSNACVALSHSDSDRIEGQRIDLNPRDLANALCVLAKGIKAVGVRVQKTRKVLIRCEPESLRAFSTAHDSFFDGVGRTIRNVG